MRKQYLLKAEWDSEATVWYIAESDILGLCLEAATLEDLARDIAQLTPEMMEANAHLMEDGPVNVPISLVAHQEMKLSD